VLHPFVAWSAAAFRDSPSDIVERAFPLACFAVQAVGWIGGFYLVMNSFIHTGRTKRNAGTVKFRRTFGPANLGIKDRQVRRLFLAVLGRSYCGECVLIEILVGF